MAKKDAPKESKAAEPKPEAKHDNSRAKALTMGQARPTPVAEQL